MGGVQSSRSKEKGIPEGFPQSHIYQPSYSPSTPISTVQREHFTLSSTQFLILLLVLWWRSRDNAFNIFSSSFHSFSFVLFDFFSTINQKRRPPQFNFRFFFFFFFFSICKYSQQVDSRCVTDSSSLSRHQVSSSASSSFRFCTEMRVKRREDKLHINTR